MSANALASPPPERLCPFRALVLARGRELYRDLPWRRTRDPYAVWISEVMLQQTQVGRVDGRWQRWLGRFPSVDALAAASQADVLAEWQGLGYNRRALALHRAAQVVAANGGELPRDAAALAALPGIGPATAAGVLAFAHDLPAAYLETNVRAVFLHELYPDADRVPDRELAPLVAACCPPDARDPADDPRTWYYALLDYGAHLKRTVPNPGRRSASHARQPRFEGSHRQKRAELLRVLLAAGPVDRSDAEPPTAQGKPPASAPAESVFAAPAVAVAGETDVPNGAMPRESADAVPSTPSLRPASSPGGDSHAPAAVPVAAPAVGIAFDELVAALAEVERAAGRAAVPAPEVAALLAELAAEGFCHEASPGRWSV